MTAPVRELLIAAILMATAGVYRLPAPDDERDLPMVYVQDGTDTAATNYDTTQCSMPINLAWAGMAASTERNSQRAQAHEALAALIVAMHTDETFGGLAVGVEYTGGGILIEAGHLLFAEASFTVRYQHLHGQPAISV